MSELPPGWVWTDTGTVTEVQGGIQKQPKRRPIVHRYPFLRVANVMRGRLDLREVHEIELFDGELEKFRLRVGDLLVVEGNGSPDQIGRAACWHGDIEDCVHQNHLIRVRPSEAIDSRYLTHYWNASRTTEYLRSVASSTSGLYVLTAAKVRSVSIPLPPLGEQWRIVAAIEEQFSRLDAGVAALERVRQNLKRMRSAILQRALTAPVGTPSVFARDLFSWASGKRAHSAETTGGQFPVFGGNGITGHSNKILKAEETIVIGRVGALCGNVYLTGGPAWITDNAIYAQSHAESILLPYAVLVFRNARLRDRAAGTGQPFVNQVILNEVTVPLPSKEHQADMVARHDAMEEAIFHIEDQLQTLNQRQIGLRSSILAAAFSGNFIAQDPEDDSASVLLERIAAERTASHGHKPTRTRKPRAPGERITA